MGRTNPTYRDCLRALEEQWQPYRRALRLQDQERYDRLWEYAQEHADAGGYLNPSEPLFPALVAIALEQEARLDELEEQLDELAAYADVPVEQED